MWDLLVVYLDVSLLVVVLLVAVLVIEVDVGLLIVLYLLVCCGFWWFGYCSLAFVGCLTIVLFAFMFVGLLWIRVQILMVLVVECELLIYSGTSAYC